MTTNGAALPLIHVLLYLLFQSPHPSVTSFSSFLSNFGDHSSVKYLQESVIDVAATVEEQEKSRKEEVARLYAETGSAQELDDEVSGTVSKTSLGVFRSLLVSSNTSFESQCDA